MKKVILVLLCCAILGAITSCNERNDIESNNIDTSQPIYDSDPTFSNNQTVLMSDEIYQDIINIYRELLLLKKSNTNYDEIFLEQYANDNKIESAVFHAVLRNHPEKMGYALKDLNNDTVEELILLDENYHIYTIFTIVNGQPTVVNDLFFGDGNDTGAIGSDGTIYKHGYGKGETVYAYAMKISSNGSLIGLEFGCLDVDIDDTTVEYYKIINGERVVIDYNEFHFLNEEYYRIVDSPTELTKKSGIYFLQMELD